MATRSSNTELKKLRAENEKLKVEVERLKKQVPKTNTSKVKRRRGVMRKLGIIFLISFAVALLTVANVLFWFGNTIVKQDRFVAATQPIIKDPLVQDSMALYTTNTIFNNTDVQKVTEEVLPPRADFLAPQLTAQLKSFTHSTLDKALATPKLQDKWNETLAKQHDRLISFASKYEGDGDININEVYTNLNSTLADSKLSFLANKKLPPKVGDITVINASWLPSFHNVVVNIDTWRVLALLALVSSLTAAVWLSRNKRRTVYVFSQAVIGAMVVSLIALQFVKQTVAGKADPQYADGVRQVVQIFMHPFVIQTATIIAAVIFVWFVAWVSGPSRSAVSLKQQISLLFSGKLHNRIFTTENKYTLWIQKNKHLLQWLVVAFFGATMLLIRLTLRGLVFYAATILILVLALEVIGGQSSESKTAVG